MGYTATEIGDMIGTSAQKVNQKLSEIGFLEKGPYGWQVTNEGMKHCVYKDVVKNNGIITLTLWNDNVPYIIGDPDAFRKFVNENRKFAGFDPIE